MRQTKPAQRPGQGKQQVNKRERIKDHRVPLSNVRNAAIIERIPERDLPMPERFAMIVGKRVTKYRVIAEEKSFRRENHFRKRRQHEHDQEQCKPARCEEFAHGACARPVLRMRSPGRRLNCLQVHLEGQRRNIYANSKPKPRQGCLFSRQDLLAHPGLRYLRRHKRR